MITMFIRDGGAADAHKVAFGSRQQHASQIVSHLRTMGDDADLRNARAMTFYTTDEGQVRNPIVTKIVGADKGPGLRGIRAITILPMREPATCSVKKHFPTNQKRYLGILARAYFWRLGSRGGFYANSDAAI